MSDCPYAVAYAYIFHFLLASADPAYTQRCLPRFKHPDNVVAPWGAGVHQHNLSQS